MFRNYLIGLFWFLVFWMGMNVLVGIGAGFFEGMHAVSLKDAVTKGGIAGIKFTREHDRWIMFISGLLVTWAMARGLIPGSPNRRNKEAQTNAKQIQEKAMRLRNETLAKIAELKALAKKSSHPKRA